MFLHKAKEALKTIIPAPLLGYCAFRLSFREIKREKRYEKKGQQEQYLCRLYKQQTGFDMNFSNPITFTQKEQWLKLYGVTQDKINYSDKYLVRRFIKESIGDSFLVPIISIDGKDHFDSVDDIDFSQLPDSFVMQCNHGSGMTLVVKNKKALTERDWKILKDKYRRFLKEEFCYLNGFEYVYRGIKPTIFFTKNIAKNDDLADFKFMCFDGEPSFLWVDTDRFSGHRRTVFNLDFSRASFAMHTYREIEADFSKPERLHEMISLSRRLSSGFDNCRVDFYYVDGQIYFGELTFSSASGFELPYPNSFDVIIGKQLKIDLVKRKYLNLKS